ncbi:MAG: DUF3822 family protein [Sphingobacteriales bacterium]|nr:MAG: DUF3822 family protein [Sphingobacteriales bacterium]
MALTKSGNEQKTLFCSAFMHHPLFNINTGVATDSSRRQLVMEIGPYYFAYLLLANETPVTLCCYELPAVHARELAASVEEIINETPLLREELSETVVLYNFPESQFVPKDFFNINATQEQTLLLQGDFNNGTILSEKVHGFDSYCVFTVPGEIHRLFQRRFTNGKYWHFYSVWLECLKKQEAVSTPTVSILFYPSRIIIGVITNKGIELVQSYAYQAAEDVAYYVLNVLEQLGLSPASTQVTLAGTIEESSAVFTELQKYLAQLNFINTTNSALAAGFNEYPNHFFSPLLNMSLCVL